MMKAVIASPIGLRVSVFSGISSHLPASAAVSDTRPTSYISARMKSDQPVVLLTNDDGPPSGSSPNIYTFAKHMQKKLGWQVRVVIPDCQKSWVGKAYAIADTINGRYFYPQEPDGLQGEITSRRRPIREADGETMEWILLSGTPATCANIALHNLYPDEIDLVLSGPNHGRNSSAAFALSSGTIGATLSSALSRFPSIALSYGVVERPVSQHTIHLANDAAVEVVRRLWEDWGRDETLILQNGPDDRVNQKMKGKIQLYAVNIPLVDKYLEPGTRKAVWARLARNGYGALFSRKTDKSTKDLWDSEVSKKVAKLDTNGSNTKDADRVAKGGEAGPGSVPAEQQSPAPQNAKEQRKPEQESELVFHFAPDMKPLVFPAEEQLIKGTDSWALHNGFISVTPLQASFAEPGEEGMRFGSESVSGTQSTAASSPDIPGLWVEPF